MVCEKTIPSSFGEILYPHGGNGFRRFGVKRTHIRRSRGTASFMDQTAAIREMVYESTSQVEAYIDEQIERMRMERR